MHRLYPATVTPASLQPATRARLTQPRTGSHLVLAGWALLICVALVVCYTRIVVPQYLYPVADELSVEHWCISLLLILLPAFYLPLHITRPSDFASWIMYLGIVVPSTLMSLLLCDGTIVEKITRAGVLIAAFFVFDFVRKRPAIAPQKPLAMSLPFPVLLPATMFLLAAVVWWLGGFRLDLSLAGIYDRRLAARDVVVSGSFMGYAIGAMNGCLVPAGLVHGIYYRKRVYLLLVVAMIAAIFSLNGTKGSVLIPLALIPIIFLARTRRQGGNWICAAVAGLMLMTLVEFTLLGTDILANFLVRRQFVLPGLLTNYYWDFFSANPHVLLSDSFLAGFIESRYETTVGLLIGGELFGNADCNANGNLWAAGFAHFGYPGVFGASLIAGCLMWFVDCCANSGRFVVASVMAAEMAFVWTNGSVHTSLLSNGILAAIALLAIFPTQLDVRAQMLQRQRWALQ